VAQKEALIQELALPITRKLLRLSLCKITKLEDPLHGRCRRKIRVRLVSIEGSEVDSAIDKLKTRTGQLFGMDALVLLSLSPEALHKAATASGGRFARYPLETGGDCSDW